MKVAHLDGSEAGCSHQVLGEIGGQGRPMGRVVVEVAGGHDQVGGVGRLDQQAAAWAQGVVGSSDQLDELVDVEVLDDVEGGDHVEGAGRQSQQVWRGLG